MSQRIISLDSQILSSIQLCPQRTKYLFVDKLRPNNKAEALERGSLLHSMMEVYYSLLANKAEIKGVWKEIEESGIKPELNLPFKSRVELAVAAGRFIATKQQLETIEIEETIFQFVEYCKFNEHDTWEPLAVEEVGSVVLFEDENIKIIYNFKIDLIAQQGKIIAPWDHKTSKRRDPFSSMNNQFFGYLYGLGLNNIVINRIGFQKTLTAAERFQRIIITIDNSRIEEWRLNTIWWAKMLDFHVSEDVWPMNITSCDKFRGCDYIQVCESSIDGRQLSLDRHYKIGEEWDVASILEDKQIMGVKS